MENQEHAMSRQPYALSRRKIAATIPVCLAMLGAIALLPAQAGAEHLSPVVADVAHLGAVSAVTYYTVEQDGFRVVTTIQEDGRDTPIPVRFVATLQAGQSSVVSVPAELGVPAWSLELVREGDQLIIRHPTKQLAAAPALP
jgi:hypothetical protein